MNGFARVPRLIALAHSRYLFFSSRLRAEAYRLRFGKMGRGCRIDRNVRIRNAHKIHIGDQVWIKEGVLIDGRTDGRVGILIGDRSTIRAFAYLDTYGSSGFIEIGQRTQVGQHSYLGGNGGLTIGEEVLISAGVSISTVARGHDGDSNIAFIDQDQRRRPTIIERNVWLATRSVVLDGVTIGRDSVAAAGSVVTRSVPPGTVVCGSPAQRLRSTGSEEAARHASDK